MVVGRPLWQVGLASSVVAAAASVAVYAVARAGGVPMELTEVFEDHFARMPVRNMAFAALLEGGSPAPSWPSRAGDGPGVPGQPSWS